MTEKASVLKIVDAKGSHYEVGYQLGTKCKDMAISMIKENRESLKASNINLEKAISHSKKYLPYAEEFFPQFLDEIRGYADAVGFKFEEAFSWFCSEPIQGARRCTDIAVNGDVTADGTVYAVHNEDVEPEGEKHVIVVRIKPDDEPGFIALSYGGLWVNSGVNAAGISLSGNALTQNDTRIGIPQDFAVRKVLASKTIGDAMKAAIPENRASSYNNIICDENGEIYSMEGSGTDFDALYAEEGYLVHTNHYLSPKMAKYEAVFQAKHDKTPLRADSIIRYNRGLRLIEKELGKITVETFKKIMADHVNHPWSICRHIDERLPPKDRSKTVFSEIIDLTHRAIWACRGNPCVGQYAKFELK